MLEFPGEGVNLRKCAVCCENLRFGLSLSPEFRPLKRAQILGGAEVPTFGRSGCVLLTGASHRPRPAARCTPQNTPEKCKPWD